MTLSELIKKLQKIEEAQSVFNTTEVMIKYNNHVGEICYCNIDEELDMCGKDDNVDVVYIQNNFVINGD